MWDQITLLFKDYTFQIVALGTGFLGLLSGAIGTYATLKKESLLGDALSHSALPGIGIGFLIIQSKELTGLLIGATISGLIATAIIQLMSKKSSVKFDSALSLVLSSFFGLGLVIMTHIQGSPNAQQAGLDSFIFGQASAMLVRDVRLIAIIGTIIFLLVIVFWKEFKLFAFDSDFGRTLGFSGKFIEFLMSTMIVLTIILGLESVGVILVSALLIGPSVAARQWSNKLGVVLPLAGAIGFVSGISGTIISSIGNRIPTGPSIVVVLSIFVIFSLFFSPERGMIVKRSIHKKQQKNFMKQIKSLEKEHGK
ncbi:zinc ABC transporter permease [Marinilactibacillus sp. 15R]|uniref:Manganese/zinc/iron transport system permease protein n=1 Tax=Marinilactibacillus piezotolerans TaxID=258723 RepID=A0A1I3YUL3_9LACT|nr:MULTISPECIES: metal ABC transporter permease [Marinilactibacillus]API87999.1 zinc ABC transporter permease [Marinilactibacillus sp. 15R]SFK35554.1 manganese/zinc/iron transport system permease protein [Marinilactibacillus piezotolerans]